MLCFVLNEKVQAVVATSSELLKLASMAAKISANSSFEHKSGQQFLRNLARPSNN